MEQSLSCTQERRDAMLQDSEMLTLLRDISDRLTKLETKIEVYFGPDGTIPEMKKKVDGMWGKMMMLGGAGAVLLFLADWVKAEIFK